MKDEKTIYSDNEPNGVRLIYDGLFYEIVIGNFGFPFSRTKFLDSFSSLNSEELKQDLSGRYAPFLAPFLSNGNLEKITEAISFAKKLADSQEQTL